MSHEQGETLSSFIVAHILGGPRDGELIPLTDPTIPVEFVDYLPWALDALDTDMAPTRTFLVKASQEKLPSGDVKWVLR